MTNHLITLATAALLILAQAGCATAPASATPAAAKSAQPVREDTLFPTLDKGMSAEVVRAKMGAPLEINPMPAPEGKAEVWIYRKEAIKGSTLVPTGMRSVPTFSLRAGVPTMVDRQEPIYSVQENRATVTLMLLMYNDALVAQKHTVEKSVRFD